VQDSESCKNKSTLATWSQLKGDSLSNVLLFEAALCFTIFTLMKITDGCCDKYFIGGAKPQVLCTV
jgi:hypothetical protein